MKSKARLILLSSATLIALFLLAVAICGGSKSEPIARIRSGKLLSKQERNLQVPREEDIDSSHAEPHANFDPALQAVLAERNSARRESLLRQWADTLTIDATEATLAILESIEKEELRFQARRVLLASWMERDLKGVARWFGNRKAADELQQQARDGLANALVQDDPAGMLSWMEKTLPKSVCNELYRPFFLQWSGADPAAAGAAIRRLADASKGNAAFWNDLIGQVAKEWSKTDLNRAVSWAQSLPEGEVKSQALVQVSSRWTETDPRAAAAFATRQNDVSLYRAVAGKWAQSDPKSAVAWAAGLPVGEGQNSAVESATADWAQKEPGAAATYANTLPAGEARNQAQLAIASVWAYTNPAETAKWVDQFPEGAVREQALGQLLSVWAGNNCEAASQWLQHLPPNTRSRDVAVSAFCSVIDSTDPDVAFAWAETISIEAMRNQKLEHAAASWLGKNPAAARQPIAQSSLPENIKNQLQSLGQVGMTIK